MAKNLMHNKRALSTVIITVILIALSMAAIVLVWGFVNNILKKQIGNTESCFGNYDKVQINERYTCYEDLGGGEYALRFSLVIGDIDVTKVIVSVSSASAVKSYEITNEDQTVSGLENYPSETTTDISLPGKNAGLTYRTTTEFDSKIDSVQITPIIGGKQCDVSDTFSDIENCDLLG